MQVCLEAEISQRFTQVGRPQTNGKAERVLRTLMEGWHGQTHFNSSAHRKQERRRWVNWYNLVKPHKGIEGKTPMEQLIAYFYPEAL
ncbi:MAG: integrase core domain-containing protein [Candidatus Marinimicrobia bacterium]|nr:integrase core domain-containing protein [Candidatus Neomarinimicrobiota bacterium]MCF7830267.1 integrase core domain-containing protein [Candidatus Neomarinimicrobiota bacterium]MCF7882176.1 integrase core domain-containing protein [Candidatus Neomarinimicrobiota bacterium]